MNAFTADLVAVKNADGSYSLLQRTHLYLSFQLVVCVRTELNTFHLKIHGDKHILNLNVDIFKTFEYVNVLETQAVFDSRV